MKPKPMWALVEKDGSIFKILQTKEDAQDIKEAIFSPYVIPLTIKKCWIVFEEPGK